MQKFVLFLLLLSCCAFGWEPREVVVVYNADSELSREAMNRYCSARHIPQKNRFALYGLTRADISRRDYDIKVKSQLLSQARDRRLVWPTLSRDGGKEIKAMVLMPDLPLRIKEEVKEGQKKNGNAPGNAAALDSELMLLGATYELNSLINNPCFKKPEQVAAGARQRIMCVCRIDGPSRESIMNMINDPHKVERSGLWGWTVVDTGGKYKQGDLMMEGIAELCHTRRMPLFYEKTGSTIPNDYPLPDNTVCYFGWYTNPANGPFRQESATGFRFAPGAIAFHLHSYSATSLHDGKTWVSALLKRGAAVTAGNVAEPYLGPSLNCDVFFQHLAAGKQVGEAALIASPSASWQCIILGDPLYRPFPASGLRPSATNAFVRWRKMVNFFKGDIALMKKAVDEELPRKDGAVFAESYAGICRQAGKLQEAEHYYLEASKKYTRAQDVLRCQLCRAYVQKEDGRPSDASQSVDAIQAKFDKSVFEAAVKKAVGDLAVEKK